MLNVNTSEVDSTLTAENKTVKLVCNSSFSLKINQINKHDGGIQCCYCLVCQCKEIMSLE